MAYKVISITKVPWKCNNKAIGYRQQSSAAHATKHGPYKWRHNTAKCRKCIFSCSLNPREINLIVFHLPLHAVVNFDIPNRRPGKIQGFIKKKFRKPFLSTDLVQCICICNWYCCWRIENIILWLLRFFRMYLDQVSTDELRASWEVETGSYVCGNVPFPFPFPRAAEKPFFMESGNWVQYPAKRWEGSDRFVNS